MGADLFHADGRTDMTKLIVAFCKFANMPENWTTDKVKTYVSESCTIVRDM